MIHLPASAATGQSVFLSTQFGQTAGKAQHDTCNTCHTSVPGPGTNLNVRIPAGKGPSSQQPFKIPHLRNLYWKTNADFTAGAVSVNGFAYNHDGAVAGISNQASQASFGVFFNNPTLDEQVEAFELCFDTGTPAATGYSRTLTAATVSTSRAQTDWHTLQTLATAGTIDLVAHGHGSRGG